MPRKLEWGVRCCKAAPVVTIQATLAMTAFCRKNRAPAPTVRPCRCRTSNEDGVGIAWAVCEQLLVKHTYAICITHYHELAVRGQCPPSNRCFAATFNVRAPNSLITGPHCTANDASQELAALYPTARNTSMAVRAADGGSALQFTYTLSDGSSPHTSDYGIQLAEVSKQFALKWSSAPHACVASSAGIQTESMQQPHDLHCCFCRCVDCRPPCSRTQKKSRQALLAGWVCGQLRPSFRGMLPLQRHTCALPVASSRACSRLQRSGVPLTAQRRPHQRVLAEALAATQAWSA